MLKYEKPCMEMIIINENIVTLSNVGPGSDFGSSDVNAASDSQWVTSN